MTIKRVLLAMLSFTTCYGASLLTSVTTREDYVYPEPLTLSCSDPAYCGPDVEGGGRVSTAFALADYGSIYATVQVQSIPGLVSAIARAEMHDTLYIEGYHGYGLLEAVFDGAHGSMWAPGGFMNLNGYDVTGGSGPWFSSTPFQFGQAIAFSMIAEARIDLENEGGGGYARTAEAFAWLVELRVLDPDTRKPLPGVLLTSESGFRYPFSPDNASAPGASPRVFTPVPEPGTAALNLLWFGLLPALNRLSKDGRRRPGRGSS